MASVRLPDLETIRRFSIAVRSEHADADEVIEALREDLTNLLRATGRLKAKDDATPAKKPAARKASTKKPASKKATRRSK
ncbi:MAG: hypothetical protein ACLGH3_00135 [Actinomycetota bacterium]